MQFDINQFVRIDPKMYRHFAVVTLIITACVGFFADTENREAVAGEMDRRDQQVELRKAEEAKQAREHSTFENRAASGPAMADDVGGGYGAPMDNGGSRGMGSSVMPASYRPLAQACGRAAADRNALARMSQPQREAYLAKLDEMDCSRSASESQPHQPTQSEISALAAASAARSGSGSVD